MGIPGLYGKFLSKAVIEAIFQGLPLLVSGISFDLNGVIHDARKQVLGDGITDPRVLQAIANTPPEQLELEIQNATGGIILRMVQAANPRDYLILAVDGVAPGAKLQQQKGRREIAARERSPIETFDRNAITPGTDFMMRMDNFLVRFIGKYRNQLPPKVIYSSHLVPGEGEHKIMDYYRRGEVNGETARAGGAHILYGLDADLIMLSLLAPINNIYLSRETVKETVNIDRVREYLMRRGKRETAVDDFVVMMYLLGNDFLPHNPAFEEMAETISILLDIYEEGNYSLTKTNANGRHEIDWSNMKIFIQSVAARENELLAALATKPVTYPSRFLQAALREGQFYPDVFRSTWYRNALGTKGPEPFVNALTEIISRYQPQDQQVVPITIISEITPDRIVGMTVDYMRTMSWIYLYYREGTDAIDHDWSYPHYHTPMLSDLSSVMQLVDAGITITGYEARDDMLRFTALHQLVAVLPLKSRELLPIELSPLFSYNSVLRDLLPETFIVEVDGKNKYGTGPVPGVPIVPLIDRRRIIEAVAQITFTVERVQLWMPAEEQFFVLTPDEVEIAKRLQFDRQRQADFMGRQAQRGRGRGRGRGEFAQPQERQQAQPGLVPTMTATQGQRSPRAPTTDRGRGTRGRGDRGGRGRATLGTRDIRRPPTIPAQQPRQAPTIPTQQPLVLPQQERIQLQQPRPEPTRGQMVIQRGPPTTQQRTAPTVPLPTQQRAAPIVPQRGPPIVPLVPQQGGRGAQQGPRSPAQWKQLNPLM